MVLWTAGAGPVHGAEAQSGTLAGPVRGAEEQSGTLQELKVSGTGQRVIVALVGDRPLDGRLQVIGVPPTRIFVDLSGIVPDVNPVTDVHRGAVRRVRVALNRARPPVTRVVLDLEGGATFSLDRNPADNSLRIVVDASSASDASEAASNASDVVATKGRLEYTRWFTNASVVIERLVQTDGLTHLEELDVEWQAVQQEVQSVTPPPTFVEAHRALTTAVALGRETMTERRDGGMPSKKPSALAAGASLSLSLARELARPHLDSVNAGQ